MNSFWLTVRQAVVRGLLALAQKVGPTRPSDPLLAAARLVVSAVERTSTRPPSRHTNLVWNLTATRLLQRQFPARRQRAIKLAIEQALNESE